MYKLTYQLSINNQIYQQILSITEEAVLIEINNKQLVYIKELDGYYVVDNNSKTLHPAFSEAIKQQMESYKTMIGKVKSEITDNNHSYKIYHGRKIKLSGKGDIILNTELITAQINEIKYTAYASYLKNEGKNQAYQLPLKNSELVAYNQTNIIMSQGIQSTIQDLLSIKKESISLSKIQNYEIIL